MNNHKFSIFNHRSIFVFSLILSFFSGILIANITKNSVRGNLFGQDTVIDENYFQYYNMFRQAYKKLQDEFVDADKVDSKTLLSGAIRGMLISTEDAYTDFLSPEIAAEFAANINASFYGVGIRMEMRNGGLTVIAPIKGSPAAEADLQAGDQIIEIDKVSTKGMSSLEAVGKIRGKLGTSVEFTIIRPGVLQPFTVNLKRAKIDIDTVEFEMIPYENKKIAYFKLIEFGVPTEKEFEKFLKEALSQNLDGIIIDVRNNPGGLLSSVARVTDTILNEGLIVYTRGRIESENVEFKASSRNTLVKSNIPITVLGNQGSASASEILIAALKDTGRASFVGKKTFGKGSVQKTYPLTDGSLLKYTIAKYYSPDGNSIDKIGLEPNIEVDMWYDMLNEAQKTSVIQIQMTNYIGDLLQKTAYKPSKEDIEILYNKLSKDGYNISRETLGFIVLQRQNAISDNVYNLAIDFQLSKALEITANAPTNINIKSFHKTKTLEELKVQEQQLLKTLTNNSETNN